jgi:Reeler domain
VTVSGGELFRGFFFQARDAKTQAWVGEFMEVANMKTLPECSAITQADNRDKTQATLVWKAPDNQEGQVFFT